MTDIYKVLFLFALLLNVHSQLSKTGGYCLDNCDSCHPSAISKCIGSNPCQYGFYDSLGQGVCNIIPSLQISYQELNSRTKNALRGVIWGEDSKLSKCNYEQMGIKQQIDILGPFSGSVSLEKQFKVPQESQFIEIKFSLVRDNWLPFNDFLIIELVDGSEIIKTFEISYQQRVNMTSYELNVKCGGKKVIIQRYTLKIDKNIIKNLKNDTLKVVFNSFLDESVWGITNFQIIAGCTGFMKYSQKNGKCNSCDSNGYFLHLYSGYGNCRNCPQLCKTCISQNKCLQCNWGTLADGKCQVSQAYKFQEVAQNYFNSTCNSYSMLMSSSQRKIVLPTFKNPSKNLYDQVFPVITVFYDPFDVKKKDKINNQIALKINEQIIRKVTLQDNVQFVESCKLFPSQRMAKISIVGPIITINDNKLLISIQAQGITSFSIGKVLFYFLDKLPRDLTIKKLSQDQHKTSLKQVSTVQIDKNKQTSQTVTTPLLLQSFSDSKGNNKELVSKIKFNQAALSQNLQYLVSNNGSLVLSIFDIPTIKGKIEVQIQKLKAQDFKLIDTYFIKGILIVQLKIFKSFIDSKVIVKQVTKMRLLQPTFIRYLAKVQVSRFDAISQSQLQSLFSLEKTFQVFAWLGIIAIIFSLITGFGVVIQEYIVTLQVLYLHIYLSQNILPLSFSHTISGLRGASIPDFFNPLIVNLTPWSLNSQMLYKLLPSSFSFFYAFLPLLLTSLSYFIWFIALVALKKWLLPRDIPDQSRGTLHKIIDGVVCRVMNYVDTIWRYQLIAVFLLCFKQFSLFHYEANTGQLAFSITVLLIYLGWCAFSEYYVRKQYYEYQYSYFLFKFQDRFFCRIPQHSLPSRHHRLGYPLLKMVKALVFVIVTFIPQPIVAILIFILINTFELWYVFSTFIFSDSRMLKFKMIQGILLVVLEVTMLILVCFQSKINVDRYICWGFLLATIALLIVINGLLRIVFSISLKYLKMKDVNFQEVELDQKKLQTERAV